MREGTELNQNCNDQYSHLQVERKVDKCYICISCWVDSSRWAESHDHIADERGGRLVNEQNNI